MLLSLALLIVLSAVALFFASFLSWMVFKLHKDDWKKFPNEDAVLAAVGANATPGSYMVPGCKHPSEMSSPEFQKKMETGPRLIMTVMPKVGMGQSLVLTFIYFLVVSFILAYLASIAFPVKAEFMDVFRFVFTAGLAIFLSAMVAHSIWFRSRIVGHIIESIAYAAIVGAIFAGLWPK